MAQPGSAVAARPLHRSRRRRPLLRALLALAVLIVIAILAGGGDLAARTTDGEPAAARRRAAAPRPLGAGDGRARRPWRADDPRRQPAGRRPRPRLPPCPGALLPDGPAAAAGRGRARGDRRAGGREGRPAATASIASGPRTQALLAAASPEDRALLEAYTDGVNAGLSALGGKPFEYLLLRVDPAPWRPEDSVLGGLRHVLRAATMTGAAGIPISASCTTRSRRRCTSSSPLPAPSGTRRSSARRSRRRRSPDRRCSTCASGRRRRSRPFLPSERARRRRAGERLAAGSNNWAVAGCAHRGRPRAARQRHAPRHPRAQHLVPRVARLVRPDGREGARGSPA